SGKDDVFEGVKVLGVESEGERENEVSVDLAGRRCRASVVREGDAVHVFYEGTKHTLRIPVPEFLKSKAASADAGSVVTPMPCKISQVLVKPGDKVQSGQPLIVLEAMKMEHVIRSPQAGSVKKVFYKVGDIVAQGKQLVSFDEGDK
ncbi:hypothetical protein HK102_003065, partial [Quaeritorhiza haematococci]